MLIGFEAFAETVSEPNLEATKESAESVSATEAEMAKRRHKPLHPIRWNQYLPSLDQRFREKVIWSY